MRYTQEFTFIYRDKDTKEEIFRHKDVSRRNADKEFQKCVGKSLDESIVVYAVADRELIYFK